MTKTAVIALNGNLHAEKNEYKKFLRNLDATFIAADGGALLLEKIGLNADIILGDLDSLDKRDIERFKNKKIDIIKYPVEKNETDGELAINYCIKNDYDKVILIFALGGRFDQQFANIFLLEYAKKNNLKAEIREAFLEIALVDGNKTFNDKKEWGLSLLPLDKKVENVSIKGCKYSLDSFDLLRNKTRGISNVICKDKARISHEKGELLYILNNNMHISC